MMSTEQRIQNLRRKLVEKDLDALLVSQPENLYYLTGCEGLEGYLLVNSQRAIIATDFRYIEQAERQSPHCELFRISGKMADWLPVLLHEPGLQRSGFEAGHLSLASYRQISGIVQDAGLPVELLPTEGLVESLRIIKDPDEIENIRQAAMITDSVFDYVNTILRPGITEKQLAWEIEKYMRENGSQPVPFELIVAAGPDAALPHAKPSDYPIQANQPVIIDIGSKYNNYGSDLTRTFYIGEPDETFRKIYDTVLQAQLAAIAGISSGMTGAEADAIARRIIAEAGYGEAFGHSLGHGIGLVTHEKPVLSPNSLEPLQDGMVFTIEPGIYISGWGGVRIEDDVLLDNGKLKVISFARK